MRASSGTPTFTTSITGTNTLWLTASPDSGKLPGSLSAQVNPTSLPVGSYQAAVTVTVAGVSSPLSVPVTLNVTSPPATLALSGTTLSFSVPPNPPPAQTITLSTASAPLSFTVASGSPWLQVSPTAGIVLPGDQVPLGIAVDASTLAPQAAPYAGKITVTQAATAGSAAKAQTITVNLTVNASAPTISSVWPGALPMGGGPQTITIRGTNFYAGTTVKVQGMAGTLTTTLISPSTLLAVVPASMLAAAGTLNIIASNPAPGGDSLPSPIVVGNLPTIGLVGSSASYASISISPGELVTIFGTNLGPTVPVGMNITNGYVSSSSGGLSVLIDGQAAPILYANQNQVTVQVPYEATIGAGKSLSVTNGANPPANATVTISPTAPGLYTADGSGVGQAAALNFNTTAGYSLNTASNPVHLGDMIILYVTGEGDYNPSINPRTGLVVPSSLNPLPQLSPPPTVSIGGAAATVAYAGPLVGSILGLLQINATVPSGSTTGQTVPVIVTIGGVSSQSATISVHP